MLTGVRIGAQSLQAAAHQTRRAAFSVA